MSDDRRELVLDSALQTFARFGYRKTSMEAIAQAARISRPGLYFLFDSKEDLFRAAVEQALALDLAAAAVTLEDTTRPLAGRLVEAFDHWTGRYIGAIARDISSVIDDNPELLGTLVVEYPERFSQLVTAAVAGAGSATARTPAASAADVAATLISTSIGIKQQVQTREQFVARLAVAVDLIVR